MATPAQGPEPAPKVMTLIEVLQDMRTSIGIISERLDLANKRLHLLETGVRRIEEKVK